MAGALAPLDGTLQVQTTGDDGQAPHQQQAAATGAQDATVSTGSKRALRQQGRVDYTEAGRAAPSESDDSDDPAPKRPRLATGQVLL